MSDSASISTNGLVLPRRLGAFHALSLAVIYPLMLGVPLIGLGLAWHEDPQFIYRYYIENSVGQFVVSSLIVLFFVFAGQETGQACFRKPHGG